MKYGLTSATFVSPLSLADAKTHLRVTSTDEDSLISSLVEGAARAYETLTNRAIVRRTFTLTLDTFPDDPEIMESLTVPVAPLVSVTSIVYINDAGTATTWGSSNYVVDTNASPGRIALGDLKSWPVIDNRIAPITVTLVAGESTSSASVNGTDLAAIRLWTGHLYQHREAVVTGTIAQELPLGLQTLVWSRKVWVES